LELYRLQKRRQAMAQFKSNAGIPQDEQLTSTQLRSISPKFKRGPRLKKKSVEPASEIPSPGPPPPAPEIEPLPVPPPPPPAPPPPPPPPPVSQPSTLNPQPAAEIVRFRHKY